MGGSDAHLVPSQVDDVAGGLDRPCRGEILFRHLIPLLALELLQQFKGRFLVKARRAFARYGPVP